MLRRCVLYFFHVVHFRCHFCFRFGGLTGNLCFCCFCVIRWFAFECISAPRAPRTETLVDGLPSASTSSWTTMFDAFLLIFVIFVFEFVIWKRSTSPPGGNQVDSLPPALSLQIHFDNLFCKSKRLGGAIDWQNIENEFAAKPKSWANRHAWQVNFSTKCLHGPEILKMNEFA